MVRYKGDLQQYSYQDVQQSYPQTQKLIYDVLLALTPAQVAFEVKRSGKTFNNIDVDRDTFCILGTALAALTENQNLIVTRDDLVLTYSRFCELLFLHGAMEQGLIEPKITDTDIEYYFTVGKEQEKEPPKPNVIPLRSYRYKTR